MNQKLQQVVPLLWLLAAVCVGMLLLLLFWHDGEMVVSRGHGLVTFSNEDRSELYNYRTAGRRVFQGRVLKYEEGAGLSEWGISASLLYLSESDYRKYRATHRKGECGAAFFRAHMKALLLFPYRSEDYSVIRHATLPRWETFSISGTQISFETGKEGQRVVLPPDMSKFEQVAVTDLVIGSESLL